MAKKTGRERWVFSLGKPTTSRIKCIFKPPKGLKLHGTREKHARQERERG